MGNAAGVIDTALVFHTLVGVDALVPQVDEVLQFVDYRSPPLVSITVRTGVGVIPDPGVAVVVGAVVGITERDAGAVVEHSGGEKQRLVQDDIPDLDEYVVERVLVSDLS